MELARSQKDLVTYERENEILNEKCRDVSDIINFFSMQ